MSDTSETASVPAQEQQETDWKAEARKWESRAKDANRRVEELKPFQARAQELEEASKTETEKALERAAKAERELEELRVVAIRSQVAAAKGVPAEMLTGSSREEIEAAADRLIAFRDEHGSKAPYQPREGYPPSRSGNSELREFTRNLFRVND